MKRILTTLLTGGAAVGLLVGCGSADSSSSDTLTIDTSVGGMADAVYPSGKCKFYDDMLSPGDAVIIRGGDDSILGKTELIREWMSPDNANGTQATANGDRDICSFTFKIDGVKAGEPAYQIQIGNYDPLILSQEELLVNYYSLRDSVNFALGKEPIWSSRDNVKHPTSAPATN